MNLLSPDAPCPVASRLESLGRLLKADGYGFVTVSPVTHARVLARAHRSSNALRQAFGWNGPVAASDLPPPYRPFLEDPDLFEPLGGELYRARVRFSSLGPLLLAHSGFPTAKADAVFFGPDTYRFAHALRAFADRHSGFAPKICVDIGAGSGAGGLVCAGLFPSLKEIALLDINPSALRLAAVNSALNGIGAAPRHSDILSGWPGRADLIISNPPYLVDPALRTYRHGGGEWGTALALRILREALPRLTTGGHLLVYTGSAIVQGADTFLQAALPHLERAALPYRYEELDPDIFGEELGAWPYDRADRIASVMLHVGPGGGGT